MLDERAKAPVCRARRLEVAHKDTNTSSRAGAAGMKDRNRLADLSSQALLRLVSLAGCFSPPVGVGGVHREARNMWSLAAALIVCSEHEIGGCLEVPDFLEPAGSDRSSKARTDRRRAKTRGECSDLRVTATSVERWRRLRRMRQRPMLKLFLEHNHHDTRSGSHRV
jgi:hypothetical protein